MEKNVIQVVPVINAGRLLTMMYYRFCSGDDELNIMKYQQVASLIVYYMTNLSQCILTQENPLFKRVKISWILFILLSYFTLSSLYCKIATMYFSLYERRIVLWKRECKGVSKLNEELFVSPQYINTIIREIFVRHDILVLLIVNYTEDTGMKQRDWWITRWMCVKKSEWFETSEHGSPVIAILVCNKFTWSSSTT